MKRTAGAISANFDFAFERLAFVIGINGSCKELRGLRCTDGVRESKGSCTTAIAEAQYLSIRYSDRLAEAGVAPSVGSVGDSYDNALAETIIGLYKTEFIRRRGPWRNIDSVEYATLEWVDWFNHRRLLEPIGNIPPVELEAS